MMLHIYTSSVSIADSFPSRGSLDKISILGKEKIWLALMLIQEY